MLNSAITFETALAKLDAFYRSKSYRMTRGLGLRMDADDAYQICCMALMKQMEIDEALNWEVPESMFLASARQHALRDLTDEIRKHVRRGVHDETSIFVQTDDGDEDVRPDLQVPGDAESEAIVGNIIVRTLENLSRGEDRELFNLFVEQPEDLVVAYMQSFEDRGSMRGRRSASPVFDLHFLSRQLGKPVRELTQSCNRIRQTMVRLKIVNG